LLGTRRIIVTGATGIVGANFIKHLSAQGLDTIALVRPDSLRIEAIQNIKHVKVVSCDLSSLTEYDHNERFDIFYHFGWEDSKRDYRNDSYRQNRNIQYTLDAVKLAAKLGCNTFVGIGSQAEYGRVADKISPETPTFPDSAYGAAKLCAYKLSQIYANTLGVKHIWARIFSVYGPYDNPDTLISTAIRLMLQKRVPDMTKGEQLWDYLHADDLARALFLLGKKGDANSVYCIGSGQTRSIQDYIEILRDCIDPTLNIDFGKVPYNDNQIMHLCADIEKLTKDTGFLPEISFEEGIKRTVEWHRSQK
jgi:UDP-glucose 4-epimerase